MAEMVTDQQVRRLYKLMHTEKTRAIAAAKAGMDEKTARKYIKAGMLPSDLKKVRDWRTRKDPFAGIWEEVREKLETNPGLEAKTLFDDLQGRMPGRFSDGQLRSFQRRVKYWRAVDGPGKEIFFPQVHHPGELAESDFTSMRELGISLGGCPFDHLLYHFVLTYSNWETGSVCYSESFESLSAGLQNALWELGGVPRVHQTDRLTAAVHNALQAEEFTQRYQGLLKHYGLTGRKTQPASPHENGDVEQRNYRFKRALKQELLLRGSTDFENLEEYKCFLKGFFARLNQGRRERFLEEQQVLQSLPDQRMESCKRLSVRVGPSSTIRISHNVYSVASRLIGEHIEVRLYAEHIEIYYAQKHVDTLPRLRGENRCLINYRHIIDQLERKPGAFENYRYREELFPGSHFRLAYDELRDRHSLRQAVREYLKILQLAAKENETSVGMALADLYGRQPITACAVEEIIHSNNPLAAVMEVGIVPIDLTVYDQLIFSQEVTCAG
jgi:Mu transposase, C-terminal domain